MSCSSTFTNLIYKSYLRVLNFAIVNGYSQNGFISVSVTDDGQYLYCPDGLPAKYHCMDLILPIV